MADLIRADFRGSTTFGRQSIYRRCQLAGSRKIKAREKEREREGGREREREREERERES